MSNGAAAMAGLSAAVGVGQIIAGGVQNKRNRQSQELENAKNRQWEAIMQGRQNAINRANWDMENAYNAPANQMRLLKEAGLDPNLVYGNPASWQSSTIGSVSGSASNQEAPKTDLSGVMAGMDKFKEAGQMMYQVNQLEAQKANIEADTSLKNAMAVETLSKTDLNKWDYKFKIGVEDVMKQKLEAEKGLIYAEIKRAETEVTVMLDKNEREKLANSANVAKTLQEITNMKIQNLETKAQTDKIKQDIKMLKQQAEILKDEKLIKQAEAELNKNGIQKSDPWYARALMQAAISIRNGATNLLNKF